MYLTQALHRALRNTPDQPATIYGERMRTVAEYAERVARLAGGLRSVGVSDGDRVAILSLNSDRYSELLHAVPWANGVVNPVNVRWSEQEITHSIRDSETSVLVVDDEFAPLVPQLVAANPGMLRTVIHATDGETHAGMVGYEDLVDSSAAIPDARRGGDAIAGVFYTGGTTGFPKGVMLTHTNLVSAALGSHATFPLVVPGGRLLHAAPMFHIADFSAWNIQWLAGGTHVVVPRFDPAAVLAAIERHGVTSMLLVPTMIQALVDFPDLQRYDRSSLQLVTYGASSIAEGLLRRAMDAFPHTSFIQGYGMTEVGGPATLLGPDDHRTGERLRSAGRAAAHSEVRIVDQAGNEVSHGTVGEVALRGPNVMAGYWNKRAETDEALDDGWLHTGDAAYLDAAGYVFIVDRLKDMIVTGGENVYAAEVENALSGHPAVATSAVIGVPDPEWGERVHAVVVLKPDSQATIDELRQHTRRHLAGYKTPRTIEFVDSLPTSGAGKPLKRELQAHHGDHARGGDGTNGPTGTDGVITNSR